MKKGKGSHPQYTFLSGALVFFLIGFLLSGGTLYQMSVSDASRLTRDSVQGTGVLLSPTTPALHFTFDELSGTTFDDASPMNRDGVVFGNVGTGEGVVSRAAHFDGVDDMIIVPGVELGPQFTVSSWIKLDSVKSAPAINTFAIKGQDNGAVHPYLFYVDANRKAVFIFTDVVPATENMGAAITPVAITSSTTLQLATWYLITVTYTNGSYKLYVNGGLDTTAAVSPAYVPFYDYNRTLYLGAVNNTQVNQLQSELNGSLDDFRIYSNALDASEIQNLYVSATLRPLQRSYTFESAENGRTSDGSDNHVDAVVVGPVVAKGIDLNAMRFDGSGYVDARAQSPLSAGKLSISAWVKPTDFTGEPYRTIFSSTTSTNTIGAYGLRVVGDASGDDRGKLEFFYGAPTGNNYLMFRSGAVLPAGDWSFVGVTFDGATVRLYVNGKEDVAYPSNVPFLPREGAFVGAMNMSGQMVNRWKGDIDALKVHSFARPAAEFSSEYNAVNLILHHSFNSVNSGTSSDDSSTHNFDGDIVGAKKDDEGVDDDALAFDGANDYVEIHDADRLDLASGSFSIGLWMKTTDTTQSQMILEKRDAGASAAPFYGLELHEGELVVTERCNRTISLSSEATLNASRWYYVTVVRDAGKDKLSLYLDGELDSSLTDDACDDFSNSAPLLFGSSSETDDRRSFKGSLDEIIIYSRPLTSAKVESLFEDYDPPRGYVVYNRSNNTTPGGTTQSCTPQWSCTWGDCLSGSQQLTCADLMHCGTTTGKPTETVRSCVDTTYTTNNDNPGRIPPASGASQSSSVRVILWVLLFLSVLGVVVVIVIYVIRRKRYQSPGVTVQRQSSSPQVFYR